MKPLLLLFSCQYWQLKRSNKGFISSPLLEPPSSDVAIPSPMFIDNLYISGISFQVTVHATLGLFVGLNQTPFYFTSCTLGSVQVLPAKLAEVLVAKYITDLLHSAPSLLGSLEIFGNPTAFLSNMKKGLFDLVGFVVVLIREGWIAATGTVWRTESIFGRITTWNVLVL